MSSIVECASSWVVFRDRSEYRLDRIVRIPIAGYRGAWLRTPSDAARVLIAGQSARIVTLSQLELGRCARGHDGRWRHRGDYPDNGG